MSAATAGPRLDSTTGLVLAGGASRRMGRDKALLRIAGSTLIERVAAALAPGCKEVVIAAGHRQSDYRFLRLPALPDPAHAAGPLAGVLAGFRHYPDRWLLVAPCDLPLLSAEYGVRMQQALANGDPLAVAATAGQIHFSCLLAHASLHTSLRDYLSAGGRRVETWVQGHQPKQVDFSDQPELFLNANTPADLKRARELLAQRKHLGGSGGEPTR